MPELLPAHLCDDPSELPKHRLNRHWSVLRKNRCTRAIGVIALIEERAKPGS